MTKELVILESENSKAEGGGMFCFMNGVSHSYHLS